MAAAENDKLGVYCSYRNSWARIPNATISEITIETLLKAARDVLASDVVIQPIKVGASSLNYYCISSVGNHVLRADLYRSRNDVELDFKLAAMCQITGVSVPPPPLWIGYVDTLPVAIRPFVSGPTFSELRSIQLNAFRLAGQQLGLMHISPILCDRPWFYAEPLTQWKEMLLPELALVKRAKKALSDLNEQLIDIALKATGLVHTDFRADNLVLSGGQIVVLDWEKVTTGSQIFDLGLALFHLLSEPNEEVWRDATSTFLKGYVDVRSLMPIEWAILRHIVLYAASIYYLVDAEIWLRETSNTSMSDLDKHHAIYFTNYCSPRYSLFLDRWEIASIVLTS